MQPVFKEPIPDHAMLLDLLLDYTNGDQAMIQKILVANPAALYNFRSERRKHLLYPWKQGVRRVISHVLKSAAAQSKSQGKIGILGRHR